MSASELFRTSQVGTEIYTRLTSLETINATPLPSPTGHPGEILAVTALGTGLEWRAVSGTGTVSSVNASGGTTGLTFTGGPVTTAGTVTLGGTLAAANGGTGLSSYAIGDITYASGAATLSRLAGVATGNVLLSGGIATAPAWGKVGLTTHVSGILPVANGGSGANSLSGILVGNGAAAFSTVTAPAGSIVGTSDAQTLTNKTIDAASNTLTGVATLTGTQTLTNKTLTAPALTDPVITGTVREDVYTIVDAAGVPIDPTNGSIQLWTLTASRTPTAANFDSGESVTLMINDGTAYTVTWSTVGVTWVTGIAPTLPTTGYGVIELWKAGSTIYGAYVGAVA